MQTKICQSCGRGFENRKKWKDIWDEIKFCSALCRKAKVPAKIMEEILYILTQRKAGVSICPSEVLPPELKKDAKKMERVRCAARLLAHNGQIVITQKSKVINPDNFKGPIRLKLKR